MVVGRDVLGQSAVVDSYTTVNVTRHTNSLIRSISSFILIIYTHSNSLSTAIATASNHAVHVCLFTCLSIYPPAVNPSINAVFYYSRISQVVRVQSRTHWAVVTVIPPRHFLLDHS